MNIANLKDKMEYLDKLFHKNDDFAEERNSKALVLDLIDETFYEWAIPSIYLQNYISGPALAARLWAEFAGADVDVPSTYESNNPIVITSSFASNSGLPGAETVSIVFRSPVTGSLCFNVGCNTVGMRLESLGYCALIITGRLRRPAIIDIRRSGVTYNISEIFTNYTVSQVENLVGIGPMTTCLSTGPAAEQKVPYASVVCEGATTGRGGLGCVFGFKNIKAICITGFLTDFVRRGAEAEIDKALTKLRNIFSSSKYCQMLQRSGSAILVRYGAKNGWAPVLNFSKRNDPRLFHLGGDEITRRYGLEHGGCISCPIQCRHRTTDGIIIPGYEVILMLGSNVGCFDVDRIIERYALCIDFGLDPISVGNVLGWAYQACLNGSPMLGDNFSFTDNSKVLPLIEMIAHRTGIGEPLSFGSYALGQAFGDDSFAYSIRGLECGPYDYRGAYAQSISDCMGFWFKNEFELSVTTFTKEHADWAVLNERLIMGLESYGISASLIIPTILEKNKKIKRWAKLLPKSAIKQCKPTIIAEALSAISGFEIRSDEIMSLGDRCWRLIYEINKILGFDMLNETEELLPEHFFIDPASNHNKESIVPYRSLMSRYRYLRKQLIAIQSSSLNDS